MPTVSPVSSISGTHSGQSHRYPSPSSVSRYPTAANRPQYDTNAMLPTMPIHSVSSQPDTMRNQHQEEQCSQSMAYAMQPHSGFSSNPPLTSLPRTNIPRSQNPYAYAGSYGLDPGLMNLNYRSMTPALNNSMPLGVQASHSFEGQGPPNSGYYQPSNSPAHPQSNRHCQTAQQGQQRGGLVNPHNLGRTRNRRPSQSSSLNSEEGQSQREFHFPPLQESSHEAQSEGIRSGASQLHRSCAANIHDGQSFEVPPLPENHKQRIADEQVRFERCVSGSISGNPTRSRTCLDAPSPDLNSPQRPQ